MSELDKADRKLKIRINYFVLKRAWYIFRKKKKNGNMDKFYHLIDIDRNVYNGKILGDGYTIKLKKLAKELNDMTLVDERVFKGEMALEIDDISIEEWTKYLDTIAAIPEIKQRTLRMVANRIKKGEALERILKGEYVDKDGKLIYTKKIDVTVDDVESGKTMINFEEKIDKAISEVLEVDSKEREELYKLSYYMQSGSKMNDFSELMSAKEAINKLNALKLSDLAKMDEIKLKQYIEILSRQLKLAEATMVLKTEK
ncbi:MAG TPA: hypothetical protein DCP90_09580 [Clostridiales bacterium]|nr:MAG: hypothetical protein A2Y22_08395 [Clostridiales bacterium GWD2_32_59]HAN10839.1 hypothetical protein [Clostridiales bacterium]